MERDQLIDPQVLTQAGLLPIRNKPARFAVGPPSGLTSNSWKVWTEKSGIYIACRDNFKEAKVSLHTSSNPEIPSRWRMGFQTQALSKIAHLRAENQNRAWAVWDEPPASLPDTVKAFQLVFPTSELAVKPETRTSKLWKDVIYIESAPPKKLTVLTLFITQGEPRLIADPEPSFRLACYDIGRGRVAQLVAHGEEEAGFRELLETTVAQAKAQAKAKGVAIPDAGYMYFLGCRPNGCRYIFGAKPDRRCDEIAGVGVRQ